MRGIYGHVALLIASLVFIISFTYKVIHLDEVSCSVFFRDLLIFIVIYNIAKYFFRYIEEMFNNYRKII
ncbi:hypothetical protein FHQ18_11135 [Deferribacter autotrophicus]|uniref:Uncharacterized protein n=1 Tax=Deferribacter autotrophicus TaxID=500465 RepID=A0A5A8F2J5_9BACT|nr:hypothetical protein [Deferribacter autotrophicus]KAA0257115.1 hypothetical protein FHQ18_11135 [Deferribacter autotrophicus]